MLPTDARGDKEMSGHLARMTAICAIALAIGSPRATAQSNTSPVISVPPVPANLEAPAGYSVFFAAHAVGTQNYVCLPSGSSVAWKFAAPQATLFQTIRDFTQQMTTHFLSVNGAENGLPRPTWQHSFDSSRVWARAVESSTDLNYVEAGAIPWLLLTWVGAEQGPEGGSFLTQTRYIQRLNTSGGVAPSSGCNQIGDTALVPYSADYFFYRRTPAR